MSFEVLPRENNQYRPTQFTN